jgi:hypothetical protein
VIITTLAALARHNIRQGRGDRKGAFRIAIVMLIGGAIGANLGRRWGADPAYVWSVLAQGQGGALFLAVSAWLYYLGFEPFVRRRWPHLLVTSTRLVERRWRDPLVGRSILIGVAGGTVFFCLGPMAALLTRLPGLGPAKYYYATGTLMPVASFAGLLGAIITTSILYALIIAGLLFISRLVLRRDGLAWAAVAGFAFLGAFDNGSGLGIALAILCTALRTAILIASTRAGGLLASAVQMAVYGFLWNTPLTVDFGQWYVWRSCFVVSLVAGLAFWGFRNVLGKQSAFPAVALDG